MRLTKSLNVVREVEGVQTGETVFGDPIYSTIQTRTPFKAEVEPFSNKLAETNYGIFVDVNYRCFTNIDIDILLGDKVEYNNNSYTVTEIMPYDRHWEVLIKNRV